MQQTRAQLVQLAPREILARQGCQVQLALQIIPERRDTPDLPDVEDRRALWDSLATLAHKDIRVFQALLLTLELPVQRVLMEPLELL